MKRRAENDREDYSFYTYYENTNSRNYLSAKKSILYIKDTIYLSLLVSIIAATFLFILYAVKRFFGGAAIIWGLIYPVLLFGILMLVPYFDRDILSASLSGCLMLIIFVSVMVLLFLRRNVNWQIQFFQFLIYVIYFSLIVLLCSVPFYVNSLKFTVLITIGDFYMALMILLLIFAGWLSKKLSKIYCLPRE
jgi:hypothetical protein